ncbi:hypothetical protein OLZ32_27795 [Rhizobium sp. 1AS11]|nr:hypothetical protein [Rhizobium acaciae]MCW1412156.1 hypothetical protein [Rhizobium acaciae]MCW1744171.1 hypothetical protein [Rhizobium acaciae]
MKGDVLHAVPLGDLDNRTGQRPENVNGAQKLIAHRIRSEGSLKPVDNFHVHRPPVFLGSLANEVAHPGGEPDVEAICNLARIFPVFTH